MKLFGDKFKWTEFVQTIAAVAAIGGGIAGFITLFHNDADLQTQISSLKTLAKQSIEQTIALNEQNRISGLALVNDSIRRIQENIPVLELEFSHPNVISHASDECKYYTNLVNRGGPVFNLIVKKNTKGSLIVKLSGEYISSGGSIPLVIEGSCTNLAFTLFYTDIDEVNYKQRFYTDSNMYLIMDKPIRITN
ncbi:hypothetical protein ACFLTA_02435 [Bacteroidota bacterium]